MLLCGVLMAFRPTGNDPDKPTILLFGDSLLEGLARRFNDYAVENGFNLRAIIWYGSTSKHWAHSKDLAYHIAENKPEFIIVSLGTNEIGYPDIARREECVRQIVETIGDIPYIWLGPITWPRYRDQGMAAAIKRVVGEERFFDGTTVKLARQRDGIHPTFDAAARWVDVIVQWMQRDDAPYHLQLKNPSRRYTLTNFLSLKPSYKGRR